eukprot:5980390-Amphidinium_carterae.1
MGVVLKNYISSDLEQNSWTTLLNIATRLRQCPWNFVPNSNLIVLALLPARSKLPTTRWLKRGC